MRFIPSLLLTSMLTMGYFFFFRSQTESGRNTPSEASKSPVAHTVVHDPYKADMDRAHLAADQMISARADADGIP